MSDEQEQESQELIPTVQDTIIFNGKPLVVVRLPDGRPGIVLRWICENLQLGPAAQVERIKRTEVITGDLVYVQVQTEGGFQTMPTLVLDSVPYWLATIDTKRVKDAGKRREILHYQKRAVAALYDWASSLKAVAALPKLVPAEPITEPTRPASDASLEEWIEYHQQMVAVLEWRRDIPPETLTPAHQRRIQVYVQQLSKISGKHSGTIHNDLKTAFDVPRYQDIPEAEWDKVEQWFKMQIERGRKK